jgi:hypothetical protein
MTALRDLIDKLLNWSGGSYVGLATLTIVGLAIAEYATGTPMVVVMPDKTAQIYITHAAPQWFVGPVGVYTIILGLFWIGKPINTYVNSKSGAPPTEPTTPPVTIPLQK